MKRFFITGDEHVRKQIFENAGELIRTGKLVAFPTETVYGLGANALDETAVRRIFVAKHRPVDNPLIVHIENLDQLSALVPEGYQVDDRVQKLIDAFWPGPLTVILPVGPNVAPSVHPGQDTIAVRMPDHPVAQALIKASGCPIAAPSANTSGRPSPTSADAVAEDLADVIEGLIDGGPCGIGVESTVVVVEGERATILRPGGITQEMIADVIDVPVVYDAGSPSTDAAPRAPGMKYRHYAPEARVHVWWGDEEEIYAAMRTLLSTDDDALDDEPSMTVGIIAPADFLNRYEFPIPKSSQVGLDTEAYPEELAHDLYRLLRDFDHAGMTDILIYGLNPTRGIGTAVMNRLQKASEGRIFHV
ncbi:L-threonylcarbamoyladenylate synthase [Alicyclobacillus dauci]|uniref:Threonylcarbamoyl-AMP synthase n=1 Tax=Alicyclobacillus dauci TaxID=1475485 RepID=A0ABY6ZB26_9BACL|nr:L-threonylcarbamoyladenylate synthase [Alicyclobacillus dauci]WAH39320.1 L-threonylcarbamoyladenylate synthase [Alicyclobacillus dauci]